MINAASLNTILFLFILEVSPEWYLNWYGVVFVFFPYCKNTVIIRILTVDIYYIATVYGSVFSYSFYFFFLEVHLSHLVNSRTYQMFVVGFFFCFVCGFFFFNWSLRCDFEIFGIVNSNICLAFFFPPTPLIWKWLLKVLPVQFCAGYCPHFSMFYYIDFMLLCAHMCSGFSPA